MINRLKDHYIVCGYGRIGRVLCRHLGRADIDVVVIEKDSEKIPVSSTSERVNVQLKDSGIRPNYNLMIIAIKKSDGRMQFNPSYDAVIAVGKADNLKKLGWVLNPQLASP